MVATRGKPDFEAIARQHRAYVWRYLRMLGCPAADADELTQESFARLLAADFEERAPAATRRYLRLVAGRLFRRMLERRADRVEVSWTEAVDAWFARHVDGDGGDAWLEALQHCTSQVQGRARQALDAFYTRGQSREGVARELGMKETGVKTLLQRLRARLRACIEQELAR